MDRYTLYLKFKQEIGSKTYSNGRKGIDKFWEDYKEITGDKETTYETFQLAVDDYVIRGEKERQERIERAYDRRANKRGYEFDE